MVDISLLTITLQNFFSRHSYLLEQTSYAVAVSGGPDSMALAHSLIQWVISQKKKIYLITVDHQLRPEAKQEAQMITEWVSALNIDGISHVVIPWAGEKPDTAIMEAARKARYELIANFCNKNAIKTIFIGHHQDDQAETFLIRLCKGSGLDGLSAMNDVRAYDDNLKLARPFLEVPKQSLVDYCEAQNVPTIQDPSNKNEDYLRPRLRASMAILEEEGLSAKRLAVTAKRLARAKRALEEITDKIWTDVLIEQNKDRVVIDFSLLKKQPEDIGLRIIQTAIESTRPEAEYQVRMEKLEELFENLWFQPDNFKPRTLGGCKFSLKGDKQGHNASLYIEKEKG